MTQTFRVSHVAAFARWREDEDSDVGWLINDIRSNEETEAMRKGTAFHKALELACEGEYATVTANGYTFAFTCSVEIALPKTRELRKGKDYGGIIISGQADGIGGRVIIDHKTTSHFDAEKYLEGYQHKFYLDIFEADRFDWYCWEMKEIEEGSKNYEVFGFHPLTQYRYPGLEEDCRRLALDFKDFAARYLPDYNFKPAECVRAPEPPKPDPTNASTHARTVGAGTPTSIQSSGAGSTTAPEPPKIAWNMVATRGTNVIGVGWREGVLRVCFAGNDGPRYGRYTGVPEAEFVKLSNPKNPYIDRLFTTNIKSKYPYEREAA